MMIWLRESLVVALLAGFAICARAETTAPPPQGPTESEMEALKAKAETGDAAAELALGNGYAANAQGFEALRWYKKAAAQGNVEAKFLAGQILLFGAPSPPGSQVVQPNGAEGLRWTFEAATNLHAMACWNLSKALRRGIGTGTNLVESYAWLTVFAQGTNGAVAARSELNNLARVMTAASVREARNLVRQFNAGRWRAPVAFATPPPDPGLKLGGVFYIPGSPVAMINGELFSRGESVKVIGKPGPIVVKCLKIEKDSVIVEIDGEDVPRLLKMR